jgi:large subunit ribosomal protein L25
MAEAVKLPANRRATRGSLAARRQRRGGEVPAVIYGHKEETISLSLSAHDIGNAIRHGVRVVNVQVDGKNEQALIRDVQWDHLGKEILHVDFERVSADERIVVTVPLELRGTAPGIAAGGVIDQPMHTLSVECLAISLPQSIRVSIGELQIGSVVHVKDLVLPPDVKSMADPDAVVLQVKAKEVEAEAVPAAEPGSAEPEVITRKVATEETEE